MNNTSFISFGTVQFQERFLIFDSLLFSFREGLLKCG